jgi:flagellar biosynthesis/type III secretory pathway M-ring protein FliF/YscJ
MINTLAQPPALPAPPPAALASIAPSASDLANTARTDRYEASLQSAREIAKQDPKIVAQIVQDWVAANGQ